MNSNNISSLKAVNPSGSEHFFVGRLFITISMSLFVIDLVRIYMFFIQNFGKLYIPRNLSISSNISSLLEYDFSKYFLMIF
jgi:hypothetical protein